MKTKILSLCLLLTLLVRAWPAVEEPIDRERAQQLHRRASSGEKLSPEDQAYYERAMAAHQRPPVAGIPASATSPAGAGDIDREKAQAIHQRRQNGEKLSAEDEAYLQCARAARRGGGDGGARSSPAPAPAGIAEAPVSEQACPAQVISVPGKDGNQVIMVVRKPPGAGPFPALIHLHGGLGSHPEATLKSYSLKNQTMNRFLAAGYMTVHPTFRSREADPQTRDALVDCLAVVEHVKKMPEVDPKSVVIWGDSGGGSLALELAGETDLCAITGQEPATVLFTGVFNKNARNLKDIQEHPQQYYTPELKKFTEEKIARIKCPVFIAHGDQSLINKINNEIVVPALKAAGKQVEEFLYPGANHGFSQRGTPEEMKKFFDDCDAFFKRHLPTQPKPLEGRARL